VVITRFQFPSTAIYVSSHVPAQNRNGLEIGTASVPVLTFASRCGKLFCECQNQRDTGKSKILVRFWI
jgi:hypothetical protein